MSKQNDPDQDKEKPDSGQDNGSLGYLRGVCIAAAWAFIGLLLVAKFWPNIPQRMAFFTGNLWNLVIAFAVIAQVIIYSKQWKLMNQSLYISERPYVVVYDIQVTNLPFEPEKLITYGATIENKGKTPAHDIEFRMYIDVEPNLLPEKPEYRGVRTSNSKIALGMNAPATGKQTDLNDILTQEQVAQIADKKLFVYIWGIVKYRGWFTNQAHHTKFYVIYDPEEKRCTAGGHHNDMT